MIKEYEQYKNSRVEWIGKIPQHWKISTLKHLLEKIFTGGTPTTTDQSFWADEEEGIPWVAISDISKSNGFLYKTHKEITEKGRESKGLEIVPKGTLLLSIFASLGKITELKIDATINQAILGLLPNHQLENKFLAYYLRDAERYISYYSSMSTQENLNLTKIRNLFFTVPPYSEQTKIAAYLDHQTGLIDALIGKKQVLMEKLKEQRQAIINGAVTKGLDPNVLKKDSGVEWLGEIPEQWKIIKLFHVTDKIGSGITPKSDQSKYYGGGINWLNTGDLNDDIIIESSKKISQKAVDDYTGLREFPENSVVIALYGATIGKLAIIKKAMATNQACCVITPSEELNFKYLFFVLMAARNFIISLSYGGGQPNISQEIIKQFRIGLPSADEQRRIIERIEKELKVLDEIMIKSDLQIQNLNDYRQSIISEAVTGKIDVREWEPQVKETA